MKFILDTHVFLWFINGSSELRKNIINLIANIENDCYLSLASIWEISIKLSLGKLELAIDFDEIINITEKNKIKILPITFEDIKIVRDLQFHHRDPFDRIIIAQSFNNNSAVISKDDIFSKYGVVVLWK